MTGPIPDPEAPTKRAIGANGELLNGVFLLSRAKDPQAPTAEEVAGGEHIGWAGMTDLHCCSCDHDCACGDGCCYCGECDT